MHNEKILVVNNDDVPTLHNAFVASADLNLEVLLEKGFYLDRSIAEKDHNYKQIIPYSILRFNDKIFYYQRSVGGGEARLHNLFSIGVGGHINLDDLPRQVATISVVENARDREIKEEFEFSRKEEPILLGFVNDDTTEVGRLHLGVVYEFVLSDEKVVPLESLKVTQLGFKTIKELSFSMENFETWSQIVSQYYFNNLRQS